MSVSKFVSRVLVVCVCARASAAAGLTGRPSVHLSSPSSLLKGPPGSQPSPHAQPPPHNTSNPMMGPHGQVSHTATLTHTYTHTVSLLALSVYTRSHLHTWELLVTLAATHLGKMNGVNYMVIYNSLQVLFLYTHTETHIPRTSCRVLLDSRSYVWTLVRVDVIFKGIVQSKMTVNFSFMLF